MAKYVAALLLLVVGSTAWSQQSLYTGEQGIEIDYSDAYGAHYVHQVEKGHTLYALSRVFQVTPGRILAFNKKAPTEPIRLGEVLRIPFDDKVLYTGVSVSQFANGTFLPVYYTIKPKETMYRVSRVYFDQNADLILKRNSLPSNQLDVGQRLLMGWIPLDPGISQRDDSLAQEQIVSKTTADQLTTDTISVERQAADTSFQDLDVPTTASPTEVFVEHQETGLAYWNKDSADKDNLFALHPTARINSLIEIYNPQLQRRTFAKVIARIPEGTYPDNIDVILSPRVAYTLGALNSEFRVRMKFFE